MKKIIAIFITIIYVVVGFSTVAAFGTSNQEAKVEATSNNKVRVGWFKSPGVHSFDSNGRPSGYDYDYLQALAQYTNWEYEYVPGTWDECYQWLKDGDIDLMNVVNKTDERLKYFDYADSISGIETCCLYVNQSTDKFDYKDFETYNGMTIAVERGTFQSQALEKYATDNNFKYVPVYCETLVEAAILLNQQKVDAALASNTDVLRGFKVIDNFSPTPFYFATTKGNTEILRDLNQAMGQLFSHNPGFSDSLYNKHFSQIVSSSFSFSKEELAYIKENPEVFVAIDPDWYPVEYIDSSTGKITGVFPALIERISEISGLKFTYINSGSSMNALEESQYKGEYITSISFDYTWADINNVKITSPFIDAGVLYVSKNHLSEAKTVALVKHDYITMNVLTHFPNLEPNYYSSMRQCVNAVKSGDSDVTFLNALEAEYYMSVPKYSNLTYHTIDTFRQPICLGVSKTSNPLLFSILNKSIDSINENEINNIVYDYTVHSSETSNIFTYLKNNPVAMLQFLVFIAFLLLIYVISHMRNRIKNMYIFELENQRYNIIADFAKEIIYQYTYATDELVFNRTFEEDSNFPTTQPHYGASIQSRIASGENYEETLLSCFKEQKDNIKDIFLSEKDTGSSGKWYRVTTKIIRSKDHHYPVYAVGKIQDIHSEHVEKANILHRSIHDDLTGLYNRAHFKEVVESALTKDSAFILIDLDNFKRINDTYGHFVGDQVLAEFASIIKKSFGTSNYAARMGGDEFAVFMTHGCTKEEIELLCRNTLDEISKIYPDGVENFNPPVSASIGVAISTGHETLDTLYQIADSGVYDIKSHGKNNIKIMD